MEFTDALLGALGSGVAAAFGWLLRYFVNSLKSQIKELKEENKAFRTALVQLEADVNESWFVLRSLTGVSGGKRSGRIQRFLGEPYAGSSCPLSTSSTPKLARAEGASD